MKGIGFEYPKGVRFRCQKCAGCCGDTLTRVRRIRLLPSEAQRISQRLGEGIEAFTTVVAGEKLYRYQMKKRGEDGKCVFLEENRCTIYPIRPLVCRFYPFQLENDGKRVCHFLLTETCPGIGRGRVLGKEFFRELLELAIATI